MKTHLNYILKTKKKLDIESKKQIKREQRYGSTKPKADCQMTNASGGQSRFQPLTNSQVPICIKRRSWNGISTSHFQAFQGKKRDDCAKYTEK